MRTRISRSIVPVLLVVLGALCCHAGNLQAHPQLVGDWVSLAPVGGSSTFRFRLGTHRGNGLWRGECAQNVSDCSILVGTYELFMINDHEATISPLRSATNNNPTVGLVDLNTGVLTLKNVTYRRRAPIVVAPAMIP